MTDDSITFESAIFQNFGKNLALLSTRCARLHSNEKNMVSVFHVYCFLHCLPKLFWRSLWGRGFCYKKFAQFNNKFIDTLFKYEPSFIFASWTSIVIKNYKKMSPSGSGQKYYAKENQQLQKDLCIPDVRTFGKYMYVYQVGERRQ